MVGARGLHVRPATSTRFAREGCHLPDRSAQAALYDTTASSGQSPHDWFAFESAVQTQLVARRMVKEQVRRLARHRGIAIVARSADGEDALRLDYALDTERVGPGVVNDLLAELHKAPTRDNRPADNDCDRITGPGAGRQGAA
jgi:hypothetical protein